MLIVLVRALTADGLAVVLIVHVGRQYIKRGLRIIMTYVKIKKKCHQVLNCLVLNERWRIFAGSENRLLSQHQNQIKLFASDVI